MTKREIENEVYDLFEKKNRTDVYEQGPSYVVDEIINLYLHYSKNNLNISLESLVDDYIEYFDDGQLQEDCYMNEDEICEQLGVDSIYVGDGMWWDNVNKRHYCEK